MEENIHNLRKSYIHIKVPESLKVQGWDNVRTQIAQVEQEKRMAANYLPKRIAFTATFVLFVGIGLVSLVQAAHPGNTLYAAKVFSQNIVAHITGNYQPIIENRGQDILDITQKDPNNIDQAVQEYNYALNESSRSATKSAEHQKIVQTVTRQEKAFQQAVEQNPNLENKLQPAINRAQSIIGDEQKDVKGIQIENNPHEFNDHPNPSPNRNTSKN